MTKQEAIEFLTNMEVQSQDFIQLDREQWEAFKTLMLAVLAEEPDPKYRVALEAVNVKIDEANAIVDEALGQMGWAYHDTQTDTDIVAEVDPSGSQRYSCEALAFKATAGGGATIIPIVINYYKRLRV